MTAFARPARFLASAAILLIALEAAPSGRVRPALADHGGALSSAPMSPVLVGLLAAALAVAVGLAVLAIVMLLTRKAPPAE